MAVYAEVLPVSAVGGVVLMISVSMMHRQKMTVRGVEFPAAAGADQAVDGQRTFAIILFAGVLCRPDLPDDILCRP